MIRGKLIKREALVCWRAWWMPRPPHHDHVATATPEVRARVWTGVQVEIWVWEDKLAGNFMDLMRRVDVTLVPLGVSEVGQQRNERATTLAHVPIHELIERRPNPGRAFVGLSWRVGRVNVDTAPLEQE